LCKTASVAGIVLSFIACFILLVIASLRSQIIRLPADADFTVNITSHDEHWRQIS